MSQADEARELAERAEMIGDTFDRIGRVGRDDARFLIECVEKLPALLARHALEARLDEAKWWKLQIESRIHGINFYQHMNFDVADKIELERIAALEQAAAGGERT